MKDGFKKAFSIETSRGCPHGCGFCHNTILNHKYRTVETDYVIKSIKDLYELYKIDGVIFQEDNFFLDQNRVLKIIDYLDEINCIGWKANSRISYFDRFSDKFLNRLENSNCKLLQFGIEAGSNRILKLINKKITVEEIIEINKKLARFNIKIRYNFIIGFPTETVEEIHTTLKLIEILRNDNRNLESPFVNIYTPYPGTPVYNLAIEQGFIPPPTLYDWSKISWNETNNMIKDKNLRSEIFKISNQYVSKSNYLR